MNTTYDKLVVVVTAGADKARLHDFAMHLRSNAENPSQSPPVVAVLQREGRGVPVYRGMVDRQSDFMGVVPAFARGVQMALQAYPNAEIVACLHDDCLVHEPSWDSKIVQHFSDYPTCGLAGFGGAWGCGREDAGQGEYHPTWLVRRGFMSNMRDAETHGARVRVSRPVACLDGFSLIFRRDLLIGRQEPHHAGAVFNPPLSARGQTLFSLLVSWGVVHHVYDIAVSAFAKQLGWDTWLLAYDCQHLGGQTAVGDSRYAEWAKEQRPATHPSQSEYGDQTFWEEAHRIVWQRLGHLLPFEVQRL